MKAVANIQRILLGLIVVVYGMNGLVRFSHAPSFDTAVARQFMAVMQATPYAHVLFALQVVCGTLLVANVFVPAALTVLAGYLFNIYMFHIFLDPSRSVSTAVVTVLWFLTFARHRSAFQTLLRPRASVPLRIRFEARLGALLKLRRRRCLQFARSLCI